MVDNPYLVTPGKKFKLNKRPTDAAGSFNEKDDAASATAKNLRKLDAL